MLRHLCLISALLNLFLLDMAADNTLTFTNISLTSENMDETAFTVSAWGGTAIKLTGISQEAWSPGPGGGGGGSSRPSAGFLYPRGQG